ncbi:hypothetical protein ACQ4PT_025947 [Festuca glaucescens]
MLPPRLSTHPQMGRAAVCLTVLLLAIAFLFASAASDSESLRAEQRVGAGRNPPVHCCKQEEAVARQTQATGDVASAEEQGQKPESLRSKKEKINDDDDDDNDDDNYDDDDDDDDDDGHDNNGGSDTDLIGSELASGHGSHSANDPNNHHDDNSKSGKKKRSAPVRKGVQGGDR